MKNLVLLQISKAVEAQPPRATLLYTAKNDLEGTAKGLIRASKRAKVMIHGLTGWVRIALLLQILAASLLFSLFLL